MDPAGPQPLRYKEDGEGLILEGQAHKWLCRETFLQASVGKLGETLISGAQSCPGVGLTVLPQSLGSQGSVGCVLLGMFLDAADAWSAPPHSSSELICTRR